MGKAKKHQPMGRVLEFSESLRPSYLAGFGDAQQGNNLAACEKWADQDKALAYICGGMDGEKLKGGRVGRVA